MRSSFAAALALLAGGCGYVGDPLPPALHIPRAVSDLRVAQVGSELVFTFTIPGVTTEDLPLGRLAGVELRIAGSVVQLEQGFAAPVAAREAGIAEARTPAAPWIGRREVAAVRLRGDRGKVSEWSAPATVHPIEPLPKPMVSADSHERGVVLNWTTQDSRAIEWIVHRKAASEPEFTQLAAASGNRFVDENAKYGEGYTYRIEASVASARSELSDPVSITPEDRFAPPPPKNVTAIAGITTVELAWERSAASDVKSYRVYRAGPGEFAPLSDPIETPSFSDRGAASGVTYRYRITALDVKGNEGRPSEIVEITAP